MCFIPSIEIKWSTFCFGVKKKKPLQIILHYSRPDYSQHTIFMQMSGYWAGPVGGCWWMALFCCWSEDSFDSLIMRRGLNARTKGNIKIKARFRDTAFSTMMTTVVYNASGSSDQHPLVVGTGYSMWEIVDNFLSYKTLNILWYKSLISKTHLSKPAVQPMGYGEHPSFSFSLCVRGMVYMRGIWKWLSGIYI